MKKFFKTLAAILLILTMICVSSVSTFAALPEDNTVEPQWESILDVAIDMVFSGTEGNAAGVARKQSTATRIEGTLTVYKEVSRGVWHGIDQVYGSKTVGSLGLGIDFTGEEGVRYKVIFEVTAYTGSTPETETFERIETC